MRRREAFLLTFLFVVSVALLAFSHYRGDPAWLEHLPAAPDGVGILWQVQTTFLSVGFAGLAIAAQLFAESPLAIGASRERVLEHVGAGRFASIGLVANIVLAVQTIWLPSDLGILTVAASWFVATVVLLVLSTLRLIRLFSNPSLLDKLVRDSLVEALASRLDTSSRRYADASRQMDELYASGLLLPVLGSPAFTLSVPVPRADVVVRAIKPHVVRRAVGILVPRTTDGVMSESGNADLYTPPQITLELELGDRTRLGETAFRVGTSQDLDETARRRAVRLLQTSIDFEPPGTVTPYEETDREISKLKDTIGTNLRVGAFGTAERALELLGQVVRGVWTAHPESLEASRRSSFTRRDWVHRSIGEAEQDVLLSPRVAGLFVSQAMARALEAPRTGSNEYADECLRSFTRIWSDVLRHGGNEFEALPATIVTCVQNLAAFAFSTVDLQARATWAMVELVKLALDAKKPESAWLAARELDGLFEYSERNAGARAHVRAGQLVLAGWLDYLADKSDDRDPTDAGLRALLTPRGTWSEILSARDLAERGAAPFSRWDWWEIATSPSGRAQALQLSSYIDKAEVAALASSRGPLPPANDQEAASTYQRFTQLLDESGRELSARESNLKQKLTEEVSKWEAAENDRLAREPLSQDKITDLQTALRESLSAKRLASEIPRGDDVPDSVDQSRPILGMNLRVPRHYLVDSVFNQTYADPEDLGRVIAQGFAEGEEHRIIQILQTQEGGIQLPTAKAILQQIHALGDDAAHYVLVTPYGGLMDIDGWYSREFRDALSRVKHFETSVLDNEAILFDRRAAVISFRHPEEKRGLTPVEGTSIALGVFEDVQSEKEPQVRIETGEYFVVWASESPRVHRFAAPITSQDGKTT